MGFDIRSAVQRSQVTAFVLVTVAISWGWWVLAPHLLGNGQLSRGLVIPGGFVGGVVVWRFVPQSVRAGGLVGGLLSTLVGSTVCCALLLPLGVGLSVIVDPSLATATGSVVEIALLLGFISLYTSWAAVPVGVLTGYLYERSLE